MTQSENATLTELLVLMVEQQTASECQLKHGGIDPLRKHPAYSFLVEELIMKLDDSGALLKALTTAQEVAKKEVGEELLSRYIWRHQLEVGTTAHA
jgi:hypothetical protein